MLILAKKSGRSNTAVTIHGHTTDENVAKAWQHSSSDAAVFNFSNDEETQISAEPFTPVTSGVTKPEPVTVTKDRDDR